MNIDAGNALVQAIAPLARATARPGADAALGGFGGLIDPKAAGFTDPLLVATTDGVGTKLKVAIACGDHRTGGIDLVAMCVNDVLVSGAEPLFFLDYYAAGALRVEHARDVVAGIAEGCRQAGCALIGGETAELPGLYARDDYDLAGFCVGAVERGQVLTGDKVAAGDAVIALESAGLHSNGYSLARRVVAASGFTWTDPAPFDPSRTIGQVLLTPTRIYVKPVLEVIRAGRVHALAHITGGGLVENIPRVLPADLAAEIDPGPLPPVFDWLMRTGPVAPEEMARVFNCGIGMIAIVPEDQADAAVERLAALGEAARRIGRIVPRGDGPAVRLPDLGALWG